MILVKQQPNQYKGTRRVLTAANWQEFSPLLNSATVEPLVKAGLVATKCEDKAGFWAVYCTAEVRPAVLAAAKELV